MELYWGTTPISHPTIMMRHDFLKRHRIRYSEKYKYVEDALLYFDVLKAGGQILAMPEVLLQYSYLDIPKSRKYRLEQQKNATALYWEFMKEFNPSITFEAYKKLSFCDKLRMLQEGNNQKKTLDSNAIKRYISWVCKVKNP